MTFILRDQRTFTTDLRLDRIPQFDARNHNFPIRALTAGKPLRSRDWTVNTWLDQGHEGACVAYGFSHELLATPVAVKGLDIYDLKKVYWQIQQEDPWPGGSYPGADPVYEGTSVLSGAKHFTDRGYYKSYHWGSGAYDIASAIGYEGPVVIGVNWRQGFFTPDQYGFLNMDGGVAGGHCILVSGYHHDMTAPFFTVWNSWGKSWGNQGTARIRFADMDTLIKEGGDACLPIRNRKQLQTGQLL